MEKTEGANKFGDSRDPGTQDTGWIQTKQWVHKTQDEHKQNSGYARQRMNTNKTVGVQDTGWIQTKQWVHKTQDEYKQNSGYTRHMMNTNKTKEKQQRKLKRWATQTPPINVSNTDSTNNSEQHRLHQ